MKIIYEFTHDEEDKFDLKLHKFVDDFYVGLSDIYNIATEYNDDCDNKMTKEDFLHKLFDIISDSRFHEIN